MTVNKIPKVVHCKKEPYDVYIGRPSKWGNIFSHLEINRARFTVATRKEAVEQYEKWIMTQPELIEKIKEELKGKVLGCWCKPKACHGDILLKIANS